ncbi:amidohydrolase family protein [Hydrocarboniphaga sp.]|uniref:amidohydrolase family protein n=1 Tax=Hydrocarboniphaga sp. TaxID=2033016 RepID=UPI003D150D8F
MLIDAHQHYWRIGDNDCRWPSTDLPAIHRNYEPKDLAPLLAQTGVGMSVLVQSQPSERDTAWLLELAATTPNVGAVVGWTDLAAADAPQRIAELARHPKLRGLRPMLQDLQRDDWILDASLSPAITAMEDCGLSFDALVKPRHLPALYEFARRHPRLAIVIDHGGKPAIAAHGFEPWAADLARLARLPNVGCKLSGLATEAAPGWTADDLSPYVGQLMDCFGPQRLMWGSDWPVLNLAGDYVSWHRLAASLCRFGSESDRRAVFGGTARAFYRIESA